MSQNSSLETGNAQDRKAAIRESLPGLLFSLIIITISLAGGAWLLIASLRGGSA